MIELKKMSREEVNSKPFLINQIFDLYGGVPGEFYSYQYVGEDRWLYRDDLYCTILGIEGEYIVYTSFMLDEDYDVCYMEFDEFSVAKNKNGEKLLYREEASIAESLTMQKRNDGASNNDLDGLITHHLINTNSGEELLITYKALYRENPDYYQSLFYRPFIFSFINKGKVEQYMQYTTSTDYLSYDIITIKEFGLAEFLQNGSYALQKDRNITRYFKIKAQLSDGRCVLLYPLSKAFKEEDMNKKLEEKGFSRRVNDCVLDYYNGAYLECAEYKDLAEALQSYDKAQLSDKKLVKKVGEDNENN